MLEGKCLCKSYIDRSTRQAVQVLQNIDIEVADGEAVAIMGASGCGKSTLARILLRLEDADSGTVIFRGQDITAVTGNKLRNFRRQVQFISQRPEFFLDPIMTLGESMREPFAVFNLAEDTEEIRRLLELVQLSSSVLERYPHQVSGGEIQRICLARALLLKPQLLVLDEPTSMLDISVQAQILHLLKDIQQQGLAYIYITHELSLAKYLCNRVFSL